MSHSLFWANSVLTGAFNAPIMNGNTPAMPLNDAHSGGFFSSRNEPILSTMLRELPWSSNLHILTRAKQPEEREFYLRMATQNRWQVREVARQIDSHLFARSVLNPPKVSTVLRQMHPAALSYRHSRGGGNPVVFPYRLFLGIFSAVQRIAA